MAAETKANAQFAKKFSAMLAAANASHVSSAAKLADQLKKVKGAETSCAARNTNARTLLQEMQNSWCHRKKDLGAATRLTDSEQTKALSKIKTSVGSLKKSLGKTMKSTSSTDNKKKHAFFQRMMMSFNA